MISYFDENQLIGHLRPDMPGFDFGDSARECGTYHVGCELRRRLGISNEEWPFSERGYFYHLFFQYKTSAGFIRHPTSGDLWHRDPKEFSRDQWFGLALAALITESTHAQNDLYKEQLKHFFTAQNGDLITWEHNLYNRMFGKNLFENYMLDLGYVVNSIFRVVSSYLIRDPNHPDAFGPDINHTTGLAVCSLVFPTPVIKLAIWIYRLRRGGIFSAWQGYYRHETNPPMDELWEPVIKDLFYPESRP